MNAHSAQSPAELLAPKPSRPLAVRVREACRLTGIGRSKLYELIKGGQIQTIKVGAMTLIPMSSLEALLNPSN